MRLDGQRESDNVDDVRGQGGSFGGGRGLGSGGGGLRLGGGRLSLGTVAVALVAGYFLGINPMTMLSMLAGGPMPVQQQAPAEPTEEQREASKNDPGARFVRQVLATTEDVWNAQFQAQGARYEEPRLTLFRGSTPTACGQGEAAMGPFYCPADKRVYIDLGFFDTLKSRLGAPGDFAQAYVIAHEVGHHVQNLEGTSDKVHAARQRLSEAQYNALSVRLELQADCYAGLWAHHTQQSKQIMDNGDLEEAMNAAAQIGDDTLQQNAGRAVVPESFTHGSSAQRVRWFKRGFDTGDIRQCDTFNTRTL
ncbi:metalloprotease [Aquabacterium lacunae]|uniref:Metalloprotease n=1 Tax=Aquabacterium lacunae TaxID=2528630 RepID=A0A4Q9H3B7_9BURK|nr:neutral zinc metallopeptidase [Aquabacterium lacunae]TBO34558.1 metalloprotease [Aquabacterium lacunae]